MKQTDIQKKCVVNLNIYILLVRPVFFLNFYFVCWNYKEEEKKREIVIDFVHNWIG